MSSPSSNSLPFAAAAGSAQVAEHLRTYLMSTPVGVCGARCEMPASARLLVDVRECVSGMVLLAAPPWSDPELRFLVHPEVAARLQRAVVVLPDDVRLGFWEGLRPLPVQQRLWDVSLQYLHREYPGLTLQELETTVELFVARPGAGAPPHSTGSAVDVAAVNAFGQALSPSDAWGRLGVELVSRALHGTGLANYTPEWWHWSYGDAEWARAYDCAPLAFATTPEFDGPGAGI